MFRNWMRRLAAVAALSLVATGMVVVAACGGDDDDDTNGNGSVTPAATLGKLTILDPWVRTTTNDVSAAYFTVKNSGLDDTLISAKTSVTTNVQLHEVVTEGGTSKMQEKAGGFPVPANGELALKPGGYHVMLMDLKSPLKEGDQVELELTFKSAGTVKLSAPVKPGAAMSPGLGSGSPTATPK